MPIESRNPTTGELLRVYPEAPISEISLILEKSADAAREWRTTPLAHRADCLRKAAGLLRTNGDLYAASITREMGKPVAQAREEIEKCARCCEFVAQRGAGALAPESISLDGSTAEIERRPFGTVLAVTSFNDPFWQVIRIAASALMAGNAVVSKSASNTPECGLSLEAMFQSSGIPLNLFRTLLVTGPAIAFAVVHDAVRAIAFTGTTDNGRTVAAQAGSQAKKCVLQLSGSDPYVILGDADLALAARIGAEARMVNGGQSCAAAKRFIVESTVKAEFEERLVEEMRRYVSGDPEAETTLLGPLGKATHRRDLHAQVTASIATGAKRLLGGELPNGNGNDYPATVLTDVPPDAPVAEEETFGPVAAILEAADEDSAVSLANRSHLAMNAAVFSQDLVRARRVADGIDGGTVAINQRVTSVPELPFGGSKGSGYGRELGSDGIREWTATRVTRGAGTA